MRADITNPSPGVAHSEGFVGKTPFLVVALLVTVRVHAQDFTSIQPAARERNLFAAVSRGLAAETRATARELATFRDPKWTLLTLAQIGAATADAKTSLNTFHRCPSCEEVGLSRLVVGRHPDAHKYIVAGLIEIGVEAVAAHYLRHHGPTRKWYWRYVWTLPQSFSFSEHTHAAMHNAGLRLACDNAGMNCY
jgi:hypothetical protein